MHLSTPRGKPKDYWLVQQVCSILLLKGRVTDEAEGHWRWTAGWGAEKTDVLSFSG